VYAIVRCGGRQEKASVDDVLTVDRLAGEVGSSVTLSAVLVIDDDRVVSDPAELGDYQVTAEIVGDARGPKINMIHYRNKTGYRRRLGHRQKYTQVKITEIGAGKDAATTAGASSRRRSSARPASSVAEKPAAAKADAAKADAAKADAAKSGATKAAGAKTGASKASASKAAAKSEGKG
jgi:large subunit ribosomal protein L21